MEGKTVTYRLRTGAPMTIVHQGKEVELTLQQPVSMTIKPLSE